MTYTLALGGAAGRMGSTVADLAKDHDSISLALRCDPDDGDVPSIQAYQGDVDLDVYLDVTTPDAVVSNVEAAAERGIDIVIGTTGWNDQQERIASIAEENKVRVLYSPNFATGINALFGALAYLADVLGEQGFDAGIVEKHHTGKADAPSGTAHEMASILLERMKNKERVVTTRDGPHQDGDLDVASVRVGDEPGEHEITFTAPDNEEKLVLRHESSGQEVFASGMLRAVDWLASADVEPGLYTFKEDVLEQS